MQKIKTILILIVFTSILNFVSAQCTSGYIIKNEADTIFGEILISRFDDFTGGFVFNGINLESFHSKVYFRENSTELFRLYKPEELLEFGFINDSINYYFKKFKIKTKSIIKSESERLRFLNLIYLGEIAIYRDVIRKTNYNFWGHSNIKDNTKDYYEYYLYNDIHGLVKVIHSKDHKTVIDLLKSFEVDDEFIEQLPDKLRFKDIKEILKEYEKWKVIQSYKIFKV